MIFPNGELTQKYARFVKYVQQNNKIMTRK